MESLTINEMLLRYALPEANSVPARMSIDHTLNRYLLRDDLVDSYSLQNAVLLGATRKRTMFGTTEHNKGHLACESLDMKHGTPRESFDLEDPIFTPERIEKASSGGTLLDCGVCTFSNWTDDPTSRRRSKAPKCIVQTTVPILLPNVKEEVFDLVSVTYAKSAEKYITEYIKQFIKSEIPMYAFSTTMSLNSNLGSNFRYSVPGFARGEEINKALHSSMSGIFRAAKSNLLQPPGRAAKSGGLLAVGGPALQATYTGTFF